MGSKKNKNKLKQVNIAVTQSAAVSEIETATCGHPLGIHPNGKIILILSAILLLTIVVYFHSINNGFVNWDDGENVYDNISIRELSAGNIKLYFTKALAAMYTPFVYISFAIDYKIGGLDPRIYHATNLLLHLLNVILLFFVVRLLTPRIEIAAIVALLFAVHPLNAGAVAPVSTRGTLLYSFFFLAAFLFYLRYLKNNFGLRYLVVTLVLFLMALLSKSAAVVLPLVMLLTDYYCKRKLDARAVIEKIPFFVLSLIFGMLTFVFREDAGHPGSQYVFSVFDRIFLVGYSIVFYMFKLFIPVKLSAYYPYPVKIDGLLPLWFYPTPLVIAACIFFIYKLQNYRRELMFGALFFLINIVLVLKIVPMGGEIVCDRYAYLPYIGFFLIIGWAYCWITDRFYSSSGWIKYFVIVAVVLSSMAFSAISYERSKVWKDSLTLYNDVLEKYPFVDLAYANRGLFKSKQGDYSGAIDDYNKAIELNPGAVLAYTNRGIAKNSKQDYLGAIDDFSKAIELHPGDAKAYDSRATAKINGGKDYADAMVDFNKAIELNPGYDFAYQNRGVAKLYFGKDYAGAMNDYNKAIELNPGNALAYSNRGNAKLYFGKDHAGAMDDYNKAIELNPSYLPSFFNRAIVKMEQKNYGGAIADYNRVLEIHPRNFRAYYELGNVKKVQKDYEGASGDYSRAITLKPDYTEAYQNRGDVRMIQKKYGESIADYNEVLRLTPQNARVYLDRAWSRWYISDKNGACADWRRSFELGVKEAAAIIQEHCR
jgi:tetratricopeptide (TPR) repeat protein